MIPFIHIGPLSIPTYGLMVALGMICAAYIFQADLDRRGIKADGFTMITIAGLAGIFGSKVYSALESPTEFLAHPLASIFNRYGFTWFGGFLGGFFAMLILGRRAKIPLREFGCLLAHVLVWLCPRANGLPARRRRRLRH